MNRWRVRCSIRQLCCSGVLVGTKQNFREQCCDCGLIHRLDFRIVGGRVEFRTRRDERVTAAACRHFCFSPDE
jgi:hypothetical protein